MTAGRDRDAAGARKAKGSVQEAIGKLIGDDVAQAQGTAKKQAGASEQDDADAPDAQETPSSRR